MKLPQGIYQAQKKDGTIYYRSSITHRTRHISLGSFPTMQLAHLAYQQAKLLLTDTTTDLLQYNNDSILPFDKWVSLINFRDNNLYFKTPIYLMKKYFIYYLSPSMELKFDTDDLFYYSSHKIMQRGGHLFVADYGMQVTIHSRYGIKSHAVAGRDYRFINGDVLDFRYHNIEIINRYYGVVKKRTKKGDITYQARLHINGNYVLGNYKSEVKAAIAYNKAVTILKETGFEKLYKTNFIDGMSKEDYMIIYEEIKLSSKFLHFCQAAI